LARDLVNVELSKTIAEKEPSPVQSASAEREIIAPNKCPNCRENEASLHPNPKKIPKLACCAGGKKSTSPEIPA
jgi:hypothetical protein